MANNRWIMSVVTALDKHVGSDEAKKVLEECGRNCARSTGLLKKFQALKVKVTNVEELYSVLAEKLHDHVALEDGQLFFLYPKCYCSHVKEKPGLVSHSHCNCSAGWIKEMCEQVTAKSVDVDILQSVIRGAESCKFKVTMP